MVQESELFDQFLGWLEKPYGEYSSSEIEALWNEFHGEYPNGIESWDQEEE